MQVILRMKPEYKERWLTALRSGEYPHGFGFLIRLDNDGKPVGYCCLGVQAVIEGQAWAVSSMRPSTAMFTFGSFGSGCRYPNWEWRTWAGSQHL